MIKTITLCALTISLAAFGAEPAKTAPSADTKGGFTATYEGRAYFFATEQEKTAFVAKVEGSIYHQIGGQAAMEAAIESFYKKVLADDRIKHFFDEVNMNGQKRKQKAFLSAAFGSPVKWEGKDMRAAHENVTGLNETHFNAVAENLKTTLEELKVKKELIDQIMTIAASTKDHVLNRKPAAN